MDPFPAFFGGALRIMLRVRVRMPSDGIESPLTLARHPLLANNTFGR
jgi:hypothetical protein